MANVGSDKSRGIDIDLTWDVTDNWQFTGSFAFMDSEVEDYIGTCFAGQTVEQGCSIGFDPALYDPVTKSPRGRAQVRDGAELAPDTEGTASLYYHTTVGGGFGLGAGISARYKSSWTPQAGKPDNPSYTRLDASVALTGRSEKWEIRAYGRNLTDKKIYYGSGDIPGTGGTSGLPESDPDAGRFADLSVQVQEPREFGLVLTARL